MLSSGKPANESRIARRVSPEFKYCGVVDPSEEATYYRIARGSKVRSVTHAKLPKKQADGDGPKPLQEKVDDVVYGINRKKERPKYACLKKMHFLVLGSAPDVEGSVGLENTIP